MAIDYAQICKDNIRKHGEDPYLFELLSERLYSDRTHFILELLQNAEDANATRIQFRLFDDRLELRHDGRRFDEEDVQGVCGVGKGTKNDDYTQIGTFGIGFKSVYAFTTTPVIHCGEVHFEISHYVRPHAVEAQPIGESWTTLIVIPFNKDDVAPELAVTEIGKRLRGLTARTLLFLASIEEIEYRVLKGDSGLYLKSKQPCVDSTLVTVIGENSASLDDENEQWLVFERAIVASDGEPVVGPNGKQIPGVQIALSLEDHDDAEGKTKRASKKRGKHAEVMTASPCMGKRIKTLGKSPLVVFFATEKESHLGFLVQGPYRTTPARDNVPTLDEWNVSLVDETANLLIGTVLPSLKTMGMLTVNCFKALPLDMDDFPEHDFFFPIADAVRSALLTQELLPAADGSFVAGENAVLGRGEDLRTLFGHEQLKLLLDPDRNVNWLSGEISADNAPTFRDYLRYELEVAEITPDSLAHNISAEFMEQQPDEWVAAFYGCLLAWEALWKPRRASGNRASLRDCPILRMEDDSHVTPFDEDGHPNAYLPLKGTTQVPVVKRCVVEDTSAREFLTRLGLTEPDVVAEVIEEIIPQYLDATSMVSASEHAGHLKVILAAWSTDSITKKARLEKTLRDTPFVRFHCRATEEHGYAKPSKVYFPNEDLLLYFDSNEDATFAVTTYSKDARELLREVGVEDVPRCLQVGYGDPPCPQYSTGTPRIENYVLDGLDEVLDRIRDEDDADAQRELSLCLWRFLRAHADSDGKCFEATREYRYYSWYRQTYDALFVQTLKESKWLPTSDGRLAKPKDVSVDQLCDDFEPHEKLVSALNMQPDPSQEDEQQKQAKRLFAKQLGIDIEDIEFIKKYGSEFEQFKRDTESREANKEAIENTPSRKRDRRCQKLKERKERAPSKESVKKLRSVPGHSASEIDRQSLFDFYRDDEDGLFCQICLDPMPFVKRDGQECGECVDLLTERWANETGYDLKVLTSLKIVLCPVCSEIYRDYVQKDIGKQTALFEHLTNRRDDDFAVCESGVRRDQKDRMLHFNQTHLGDIQDCLDSDGDLASDDD